MGTPQPTKPSLRNRFPVGLSLLCPGLGQLVQKRKIFAYHAGLYALQVLPLLLFLFEGIQLINGTVYLKTNLADSLWFIPVFLILPLFTALFSMRDAATWKPGRPARPIRNLVALTLVYFVVSLLITQVFVTPESARRTLCTNNLKNIGHALHNYHDKYQCFPPAYTVDENGQPLHSWRVLLLPFLEEQALYEQIRLDEPWDSEYNKQFHDKIPCVFRCSTGGLLALSSVKEKNSRKCLYSVVIGDETPFPGAATTKFSDITDGSSNTILVVERLLSVCWMAPNYEIPFDIAVKGVNRDVFGVGGTHTGGTNVVFADGSIRCIPGTTSPETLQSLLTKAAGDNIGER
ncbi:MAG: DUF1559 domain-containing protein [Planctomycetaceae bacterium]|nr:DUF1559 domain-containing protein [Planctomycetaceae bacterium]